ncbi:inovirus Gp2 family protein [Aeromonas salmonicida]
MYDKILLTDMEFEALLQECISGYGPMNLDYLARSVEFTAQVLAETPRVFAIRCDLRFAVDTTEYDPDQLIFMQRTDPAVITRFMESLKSQIKANHKRNNRRGVPPLPAYIWCREKDSSAHHHYHVMLFFHRDDYAYLGNYLERDADNMGVRIQKAWCSALSLPHPEHAHLVHFPTKGTYGLSRNAAINRDKIYHDLLFRLAYLSKQSTKVMDGQRNFGCSQIR